MNSFSLQVFLLCSVFNSCVHTHSDALILNHLFTLTLIITQTIPSEVEVKPHKLFLCQTVSLTSDSTDLRGGEKTKNLYNNPHLLTPPHETFSDKCFIYLFIVLSGSEPRISRSVATMPGQRSSGNNGHFSWNGSLKIIL